jgi:hypothetical protein
MLQPGRNLHLMQKILVAGAMRRLWNFQRNARFMNGIRRFVHVRKRA